MAPEVMCETDTCPIPIALELHQAYVRSLEAIEERSREYASRMHAALFTRTIARRLAESEHYRGDPRDVWKNLKNVGQTGEATSEDDSYLLRDIRKMEKEIADAREEAEGSAKALVDFIGNLSFRQHLHDHHLGVLIDEATASVYYDIDYAQGQVPTEYNSEDPYKLYYREIDHYLAFLTTHLGATRTGLQFLNDILDDEKLGAEHEVGFGDVWQLIHYGQKVTEAGGQILLNVTPTVLAELERLVIPSLIRRNSMDQRALRRILSRLQRKVGFDLDLVIRETRARVWEEMDRVFEGEKPAIRAMNDLRAMFEHEVHLRKEQFDIGSARAGIAILSIAVVVAIGEMIADPEHREAHNLVHFASEVSLLLAESVKVGGESFLHSVAKHHTLELIERTLGSLCYLLLAVSYVISEYEHLEDNENALAALDAAGAVFSAVWAGAVVFQVAAVAGVCAIAILVIAFVVMLITDPPVIKWLRHTPWGMGGEHHRMEVEHVVPHYFTEVHSVSVRLTGGGVELKCDLLAARVPVRLHLIQQEPEIAFRVIRLTPDSRSVDRRGEVEFQRSSHTLLLHKSWEIWPDIKLDGETKYRAVGEVDPLQDGTWPLRAECEDQAFGKPEILPPPVATWIPPRMIRDGALVCPSDRAVELAIQTVRAKGVMLRIELRKDRSEPVLYMIREPVRSNDVTTTSMPCNLRRPDEEGYDLAIEAKLERGENEFWDEKSHSIRVVL